MTYGEQPIRFHTNTTLTNIPAIEIAGTGTRLVTVNNPLVLNSTLTCGDINSTGTLGVKVLNSEGGTAVKIFDAGIIQFYSDVIVDGKLSVSGTLSGYSPYWAACRVDGTATVLTIKIRKGTTGSKITCQRKS